MNTPTTDPHTMQERIGVLLSQKMTLERRHAELHRANQRLEKLLARTAGQLSRAGFDLVDLQNFYEVQLGAIRTIIQASDPLQLTAFKREPETDYQRALVEIYQLLTENQDRDDD